jgi:adenylate kinase
MKLYVKLAMNIIIFGPQGSGKGTQAELLADRLNLFYFESGKFLRDLAKTDKEIDTIINEKGELLPDEEMFEYTSKYLEKNDPDLSDIIFDGYPRSIKQYQLLKNWLRSEGKQIDYAILLEINEDTSVKRLSARRICEKCGNIYNLITNPPPEGGCECGGKLIQREDDKPKAIKNRLSLYRKQTSPLISIFDKEGILVSIDGERPIKVIFEDILKKLK